MPAILPGTPDEYDEQDEQVDEEYAGAYPSPKIASRKTLKYPSIKKKAKDRPFWYNPNYWQEGTLRKRREDAEKQFGPWRQPEDPNPLYNNQAIRYRAISNNLDPYKYADMLAQRYPGMSPSMLAALVANGTPPVKDIIDADGVAFGASLDAKRAVKPQTALGQGLTGLKWDYETKGKVEIDGTIVEVGEGQAVIRDAGGRAVHVTKVADPQKETDSFAPYDWLKGLSRNFFGLLNMPVSGIQATYRNVAKDLSEGNYGQALLSYLEFAPPVSAVTELLDPENINPWEQTEFGQTILAAVGQFDDNGTWVPGSWGGGEGIDQGDGFFIGLDSEVGTAARDAAIDAYEVNGEAWTYGRGLAAAIDMDPDTIAYNMLSGTVDFGMAIVTDPTMFTAGLGIPSRLVKGVTSSRFVPGEMKLFGVAKREALRKERDFAAAFLNVNRIEDEVSALRKAADEAMTPEEAARWNEELVAKSEELKQVTAEIDSLGLSPEQVVEAKGLIRGYETQRTALLKEEEAAAKEWVEATKAQHEAQILTNVDSDPAYIDALAQYQEATSRLQRLQDRVDNGIVLGPDAYSVPDLAASFTLMVDNLGLDVIDGAVRRLSAQGGSMYGLRTQGVPPQALNRGAALEPVPGMYDEAQQVAAFWRPRDGAYRPPNLIDNAEPVPAEMVEALSARIADPVRGPGRPTRPLDEIRAESTADPAAWKPRRVENGVYETEVGARIVRDADGDWVVYRPGSSEPDDVYRTLNEAKAALDDLRTAADETAYLTAREAATPTTLSLNTLRARLRKMGLLGTPYGEKMLEAAEAQLSRVDDLLTAPGLTYRQLVDEFDRMGLLPHLDIELKNAGIDGIKGLGRREGDEGFIWWGDNPDLDVYGARLSRLAKDGEVRLSPAQVDESGNVVGDIGLILDEAGEARVIAEATKAQMDTLAGQIAEVERMAAEGRITFEAAQQKVASINAQREQIAAQTEELLNGAAAQRVSSAKEMLARQNELLARQGELAKKVGRYEKDGVLHTKNLETLAKVNQERLAKLETAEATRDMLKARLGGIEGAFGQRGIDYDLLRKGLFGGVGAKGSEIAGLAIKALSKIGPDDAGRVMLATKNKYPPEIIRELIDNAALTVDDARNLGVKEMFADEGKAIGGGARFLDDAASDAALQSYKERRVVEILANPMGVNMKVGARAAHNLATQVGDAPSTWAVSRRGPSAILNRAARGWSTEYGVGRAGRIIPGAVHVSLSDGKDLASKLDYYAVQMNKDPEYRAALFQRVFEVSGEPGMEGAAKKIITDTMKDMLDEATNRVMSTNWGRNNPDKADKLKARLHDQLIVWNKEVGDTQAYYQFSQADGMLDHPHIIDAEGEVVPMTSAHIEQEFANGNVFLPDPREFYRMTSKISSLFERSSGAQAYEFVDRVFSDYWRSLVLVRPAYIVRNIAEMEIRSFLAGELNVFSNPLAITGMVFGNKDGGFMARWLAKHDKFANDIRGGQFKRPLSDDEDEIAAWQDAQEHYLAIIDIGQGSISDPRLYNVAATRGGMRQVRPGESGYTQGWARELMRLDRDTASRLVLRGRPDGRQQEVVDIFTANGMDEVRAHQEAVLDWAFGTDEGLAWRERLARGGGPSFQQIAEDKAVMRQYLYDWDWSVQNRINDFTGGDERLLAFLRDRQLTDDAGEVALSWPKKPKKAHDDSDVKELERLLREDFKDVSVGQNVKVWVAPAAQTEPTLQRLATGFFKLSARLERLGVMGPEYRQAYWTKVHEMSGMLDVEAKREAARHAESSLLNLTNFGKPWPKGEKMYRDIANEATAGPMTLDDAHRIASDYAGQVVGGLYYDATQRRAFFQATRLAMPFGQAWANSFYKWTELAAKNPVQVYRAQRAMYAALEKDSSTIYDAYQTPPWDWGEERDRSMTNWYDPNQGFVQFDDFGEPMAYMPVLGTGLSMLSSLLPGEGAPDQAAGFRLKGLNLLTAGSDTTLPPLGPALTMPLSPVMDRLKVPAPLFEWLYPYEKPQNGVEMVSQMAPAWARRTIGALSSPDNQYRIQNLKPAMAHLAQTGNYDLTTPSGQQALMDDAAELTRTMTLVTVIGQAILPTTPVSKYHFEGEDGQRLAQTAVANLYYNEYLPNYDSPDQAWEAIFNDFGAMGLISILNTTDTPIGPPIDGNAYKMLQEHPDLAVEHWPEMALLYPGGDEVMAARTWQEEAGIRKTRPVTEIFDDLNSRLYRLQKAQIDKKASELRWPDERKEQEIERLDESFKGIGKPGFSLDLTTSSQIGKVESFLEENPQFLSDETPKMFLMAVEERNTILAEMEARGIDAKTMSAKRAAPFQRRYFAYLDGLTATNPAFSESARLLRKEQS
jgi:hypothetical protein